MQKKGIFGQLNMFDFWSDPKQGDEEEAVQMISLMPDEDKIESDATYMVTSNVDDLKDKIPVMHKCKLAADGTLQTQISFYDYNRVAIWNQNESEKVYAFDNAKEAVDFYIGEIKKI